MHIVVAIFLDDIMISVERDICLVLGVGDGRLIHKIDGQHDLLLIVGRMHLHDQAVLERHRIDF